MQRLPARVGRHALEQPEALQRFLDFHIQRSALLFEGGLHALLRDQLVVPLADAEHLLLRHGLAGQPVPEKQVLSIRERHNQLVAQKRMQASFEQQRTALDVEIEETLQRFRLLKGVATDPRG